MDRRLLFPAVAMTALAQTTSPATAEAEKALRARADEFYRLELSKDFRHAEALVAEESKDYFYNSGKPNFRDVTVGSIDLSDDNTRAVVHITVQVELLAPGIGAQVFEAPATSTWKLENGQWAWYVDLSPSMATPFGKMTFAPTAQGGSLIDLMGKAPGPAAVQSMVSIDRQSVVLTAREPDQTVTISNNLPGAVTLTLSGARIEGLTSEIEKNELKAGEKATVHFRRAADAKPAGTVVITAMPLNVQFEVQVKSE